MVLLMFVLIFFSVYSLGAESKAEYFVTISEDLNDLKYITQTIVAEFGEENVTITNLFPISNGFSCKLSENALKQIQQLDWVESIEREYGDDFSAGSSLGFRLAFSWALDRLDQIQTKRGFTYRPPCSLSGKGVDVYVVDSGVLYSHTQLKGKAYLGYDVFSDDRNMNGSDCHGHGTGMASAIVGSAAGVAPGATLHSVRVLDCNGSGSTTDLIMGLEFILKQHKNKTRPSVVNLSLYGKKTISIKRAIDKLVEAGITVVSINGNNNKRPKDSCSVHPGAVPGVITASSSTSSDKASTTTNVGSCVDLYAPGHNVLASDTCDNCAVSSSGSSVAGAYVSGAVALLLEKCPNMPPWKVKQLLLSRMVITDALDMNEIPGKFLPSTPNLLLHTSGLPCDYEC